MNNKIFYEKLSACKTKTELALLADDVFEALCDGLEADKGKEYISTLLDNGLDIAAEPYENDDWICINAIRYASSDDVLDIARMIFDRCGVPSRFFSFVGTRVDYDCYNVDYVVKLYLLASAYVWQTEETFIKMNENLYEEMFGEYTYTSLQKDYKKLTLTPEIFREIEKFDFCVEMPPQKICECDRILHIFDKRTRIEVARYD